MRLEIFLCTKKLFLQTEKLDNKKASKTFVQNNTDIVTNRKNETDTLSAFLA